MDENKATRMLETARADVDNPWEPWDFNDLDLEGFLRNYLHVIFVSGFRNSVVDRHFDTTVKKFHNLDLDRIAAMESIDAQTLPIRHQRKADAFLKGCKLIHAEGWEAFKQRMRKDGRIALQGLPYMGPATNRHLAMIIGLEDTEKPDTWMKQCAAACSATVEEMVTFLSREHSLPRQKVDAYLWQYCRENQRIPEPLRPRDRQPDHADRNHATKKSSHTFSLNLPAFLKSAVAEISEEEGMSLNQFVVMAVAEKVSAMRITAAFSATHETEADIEAALRILRGDGGQLPEPEDHSS